MSRPQLKDNQSKHISIVVSKDIYKTLKIIGIQKEISLPEVVNEILNKSLSKKKPSNIEIKDIVNNE